MGESLNQEIYRSALESLPTGVYLVDRERRILLWNRGAEELTGYPRQEVVGRSCSDDLLLHCDENNAYLCGSSCPLQQTMHDGRTRSADLFLLHKDGQRIPVTVRTVPMRDEHGTIVGAAEWFDRRVLVAAADPVMRNLSEVAPLDQLTGLPSREAGLTYLRAQLESYEVSPVPFGVLMAAVDNLDHLRRTAGRNAVEALLNGTAQTLANAIRPDDMIARWTDDRFLVLVGGSTAAGLRRAAIVLKRLVQLEGVMWWGERISAGVSMGGAVVQTGDTAERLAGRAEAALACSVLQGGDFVAVA